LVEQYADLSEYGLNVGVDLDAEGEEDLLWVVQEAFDSPLPGSWTEYMDDTGRAYYVKEGSSESTWEHPMDNVYRELLEIVLNVRKNLPRASAAQREDTVRQHLKQTHQRAKQELSGWSGPYPSEQGEYYYNDALKASTWENPTIEFETELATRHRILSRCLLPEQGGLSSARSNSEDGAQAGNGGGIRLDLLQALRLQLGNLNRGEPGNGDSHIPEPSTCRSFHTARSVGSSRSGHRLKDPEREEKRKQRKERRERETRVAAEAAAIEAGAPAPPAPTDFPRVD